MIRSLDPFLGNDGLLRVGGRLKKANIEYERKFPIISPPKNHLTQLIIKAEHLKQFHTGSMTILSILGERFWPIHRRREVRKAL